MSCLACACAKPRNTTEVIKDWRVGKKDIGDNVHADWTCRVCTKFNLAVDKVCTGCGGPCPPKTVATGAVESGDSRSGRAAGHFDRPDPDEERNKWNSDEEEIDEFGRKKKKSSKGAAAAPKKAGSSISDKQKAALERLRNKGARRASRSRSR
eukprot:SRR837773.6299.p1 GENE.SRR837773.6299~~SRR837773.6299.p1  ORF type:complete len:153 (+),score=18.49 SRR837773.6299:92-550(+)